MGNQQYSQPTAAPYVEQTITPSLSCFTCTGSSVAECQSNGEMVACREPESSLESGELFTSSVCMITMRKRKGYVEQVQMGCKDRSACLVQKENNFVYGQRYRKNECKPSADKGVSVCRQCCKDGCNLTADSTISDWKYDFLA